MQNLTKSNVFLAILVIGIILAVAVSSVLVAVGGLVIAFLATFLVVEKAKDVPKEDDPQPVPEPKPTEVLIAAETEVLMPVVEVRTQPIIQPIVPSTPIQLEAPVTPVQPVVKSAPIIQEQPSKSSKRRGRKPSKNTAR